MTKNLIEAQLQMAAQVFSQWDANKIALLDQAGAWMAEAIGSGNKVIWCGNGGSATQSQHMAAEFVGRFERERRAWPSISLTENIASMTSIANDYAYDQIFSRQFEGLAQPGDVLVAISTSGNSPNVLNVLRAAKAMRLKTIGFTGVSGGKMREWCDVCLCVPSKVTARIQEVHLAYGHILCAVVEHALCSQQDCRT